MIRAQVTRGATGATEILKRLGRERNIDVDKTIEEWEFAASDPRAGS